MTTTARFLVLWGTPEDPDYFERHYREIHVPLVKKLPGARRYTFSRNTRPAARHGDRQLHPPNLSAPGPAEPSRLVPAPV
jgi:uncharacterized protein (TIGR02118 family)